MTLAGTSIIGTLIPQKKSPEEYYDAFGDFLYRFYDLLDLYDMYNARWFQFLLALITVNIIICSVERLSATWKIIFAKTPNFNLSRFRRLSNAIDFTVKSSPERLVERCEPVAARGFEYSRIEETDKGFAIFAEKYRWSRLGVYTVHLSIVLLLLGALIGSRFGYKGYVNIPEGDAIDSVRKYNSDVLIPLGFEVRCDDYSETYYDNGSPKEFRSKLTIVDNHQAVLHKEIIVNDPLQYKGIRFFQHSRGKMEPLDLTLNFAFAKSKKTYREKIQFEQEIDVPEDMGKIAVLRYRSDYNFRGQNLGEAFLAVYTPKGSEQAIELVLPVRYPTFNEMRNGDFTLSVLNPNFRWFTGLSVTKDPGVWVVYVGFIVMILGCYITFFMSHQQICVEIAKSGNKSRVMVAGLANKNELGINRKIEKISEKLKALEESA